MMADQTTEADAWPSAQRVQTLLLAYLKGHGQFREQSDHNDAGDGAADVTVRNVYDAETFIAVRGYPTPDDPAQARTWFAEALLDLALHHTADGSLHLALALPDGFAAYTHLATQTQWLHDAMPFHIYWIAESGSARVA
jgi:hypothetical protein